MLACAVHSLTVCFGLALLMQRSWPVVPRAMLCCVVRLQIRLQTLLPDHVRFLG
jgi:hypothetical protein